MCDTERNARICIFDKLYDCRQSRPHIDLKGKKKYHSIQIQNIFFWKETSTY